MYPTKYRNSGYVLLRSGSDNDSEKQSADGLREVQPRRTKRYFAAIITAIVCFALGIVGGLMLGDALPASLPTPESSSCQASSVRLEWRSLSMTQKHEYIDAVNCLRRQPSRLGLNQSLYDDFPYTHARIGAYSHHSAAFLAWHRYYLHVYEEALRHECHFKGHLTYWDWSLDWEHLHEAPVWSNEHGFGGSGNPEASDELLGGYCVTTGPFANLPVTYIKEDFHPHCLSRGFLPIAGLRRHGQRYRPAAVQRMLSSPDYDSFNLGLEEGPHNAIPNSIQGDFSMFTAPADPVFFLHHSQLDRLWWLWQSQNGSRHQWEYLGLSAHKSNKSASLDDVLPMGGLAPDLTVSEIMDTESGFLCYRY